MSQTHFYLISNDPEMIQKATQFWETYGVTIQVYSPEQWNEGLNDMVFRKHLRSGEPPLIAGASPVADGGKVIKFPTVDKRVSTMEDVEVEAIRNAIFEYKGNLTLASKALGIGRATLYRKVKYFKIDTSEARKKKVA